MLPRGRRLSEDKIDNTLLNKGYCSKFTKEEVSPMITRRYPRIRRGLLSVTGLTAAVVGAARSMLSPRVAVTQAFPQSCAGTYLITVDGTGAPEMWVLEKDGVFLSIDSSQRRGNFSDQQGAWEKDGNHGIKGVLLDFDFSFD